MYKYEQIIAKKKKEVCRCIVYLFDSSTKIRVVHSLCNPERTTKYHMCLPIYYLYIIRRIGVPWTKTINFYKMSTSARLKIRNQSHVFQQLSSRLCPDINVVCSALYSRKSPFDECQGSEKNSFFHFKQKNSFLLISDDVFFCFNLFWKDNGNLHIEL